MGRLPPPYTCASHARIGQMLDHYGIPFFYRQPALVCQEGRRGIERPDFTLPTYHNAVLEYVPSEGPVPGGAGRRASYRQNGIAALFLQPSALAGAHWQERLYGRLEQLSRQPPPPATRDKSMTRG